MLHFFSNSSLYFLCLIKNILLEEYELSEETIKKLEAARKVPDSELIDHDEVKKRFLGK